jgi:hypothetical protein
VFALSHIALFFTEIWVVLRISKRVIADCCHMTCYVTCYVTGA